MSGPGEVPPVGGSQSQEAHTWRILHRTDLGHQHDSLLPENAPVPKGDEQFRVLEVVSASEVDRLRAENKRLREAIEAHRSRVLFEAKTEFCAHRADELLWAALGGSQAKGSE